MLRDFLLGFSYLPRGAGLITRPGLRRFVTLPLLINCLLFSLGIYYGADYFNALMQDWLPEDLVASLPGWLSWLAGIVGLLEYLLWIVFTAVVLVLMFFTFTLIANLIGSPFNGLLAERVEALLGEQRQPPGNAQLGPLLARTGQAISGEIRKLLYFALCALPLLVFFWVPGIQVLWLVYGAWMLILEYADYPMGNHDILFADQRRLLRHRRALCLGFGTAVMLATMIPVVNFFTMPAAVAGATALWHEHLRETSRQLLSRTG